MPRKYRFLSRGKPCRQAGFIDILSLVAVFFLVATIVTGVTVVNKENANFDLRNKAAGTCEVVKLNTAGTCPDGKTIKYVRQNADCSITTDECTGPQNTPGCTVGTVINTAGTCPDGKTIMYVRLNADCKTTTTDPCPNSPAPPATAQTDTITPPQTTPTVPDNTITTSGCDTTTRSYLSLISSCMTAPTCDSATGVWTCPATPVNTTAQNTSPVTQTQTTCNVAYVSDVGCGQGGCTSSELAQNWKAVDCSIKIRCVPSTACATTGSPVAPACTSGQKQCSGSTLQTCSTAGGIWISQNCANGCANGACNEPVQTTPTPTQTLEIPAISTPALISCSTFGACYLNTYTCEKSYGQMDCAPGNICGTHCSAPVSVSTPVVTPQTPKIDGVLCNNDSECSSGSCKQKTNASPAKYCTDPDAGLVATYNILDTVTFGAFGDYVQTYQNVNTQNPEASYLQRAFDPAIIPTYNTLNALTFGTFGNYVQTNQNIYASNPEASYLERAFNLQNLSASAKLGAVLVAEGAILVAAAPYAVPILTGANLVDDTVTVGQCIAGDQNACAMAIPTILSPVPGTGLADDIADFTDSWDLLTPNKAPTVRTNLLEPVGDANNFHPINTPDVQIPSLGTILDEPLSTSNRNILASQMTGKLPSETGSSLAQQVKQLMNNEGLDQATAITRVVNENTTYHVGSGPVPADAARPIEQSICLPGQCRNISQISTTVANNMGVNAEFSTFKIRNLLTGEVTGHAVTPFINSAGGYGIIDATNGINFNTVDEYVNWLTSRGYTPATDIMGNINGSTIYQLPTGVQDVPAVNDLTIPTSVRDVPATEDLITPSVQNVPTAENLTVPIIENIPTAPKIDLPNVLKLENANLANINQNKGYFMNNGMLVLHSELDHWGILIKYNLDSKDVIAGFDINMPINFNSYNIDIYGPELASRLKNAGFSENSVIELKGLYSGLGYGTYKETISNISKGLDSVGFKQDPLFFTSSVRFNIPDGESILIGPGYRLTSDTKGQYLVTYVNEATKTVDIKFENGGQKEVASEDFIKMLQEPGFGVVSSPQKPIGIHIADPGKELYSLKANSEQGLALAGVTDMKGTIYLSTETTSHQQIIDTALLTNREVVGRFEFKPDIKTWIISGSPDGVKNVIDILNVNDILITQKVNMTVLSDLGNINIDARLNSALPRLNTELALQKQNIIIRPVENMVSEVTNDISDGIAILRTQYQAEKITSPVSVTTELATQSVTKPSFIGLEWKGLTNPEGKIQWPIERVNTLKITQTPGPALSQFINSDSLGSYDNYVGTYGPPPSTIHTVRDPDKLLPFQNRIVQRSQAGEITPEFIVQELRKLKSQGVNIKIVSADTLLQDNAAGWARLGEAPTGGGLLGISPTRTAEITITDPAGYASIYGVSKDEGLLIMAQKVGHEGGHGIDWVKYNISENWASEVLSKEFNIKFYSTIGQQNAVAKYQELLDQISTNSKVVK